MASTFKIVQTDYLYMLNKVDFPLTNSQISEFILDEGYTTYFKLQQALAELAESRIYPGRIHSQPHLLPSDRRRPGNSAFF